MVAVLSLLWTNYCAHCSGKDFFLCVCVCQDCEHVSQTAEEFYTVRCQVADMKNIYVSIKEPPAPSQKNHCLCEN